MAKNGIKQNSNVTRREFLEQAKPLMSTLAGRGREVDLKEFSTGSVGWFLNDKLTVELANGKKVSCQVGLTITVIDSKEWPREEAAAPATNNGHASAAPLAGS